MSEFTDEPADVPVEAAQDAVEPTSETPVPWGDDFDPSRAGKTITHLRDREKELEKQAKEFERLQQDDSAFRDFVSQRGYEIPEDDVEEPEFDVSPVADPRVDELVQWKQQQEVDRALSAFNADIDAKAAEASLAVDQVDRDWLLQESLKGGFTPEAVNKAFKSLQDRNTAREKAIIDSYLASKRAPTPPQAGKAGAPVFDPSDRKARLAQMEALVASGEQQ